MINLNIFTRRYFPPMPFITTPNSNSFIPRVLFIEGLVEFFVCAIASINLYVDVHLTLSMPFIIFHPSQEQVLFVPGYLSLKLQNVKIIWVIDDIVFRLWIIITKLTIDQLVDFIALRFHFLENATFLSSELISKVLWRFPFTRYQNATQEGSSID